MGLTKGEMMPLLEGFWDFREKWRRKYCADYMRKKNGYETRRVLDEYTPEDKFFLAHKEEFSRLLCSIGNIHTAAVRAREKVMRKGTLTDDDIAKIAECDRKIEEFRAFRERKDRWEEKNRASREEESMKRKEDYRNTEEYLSRTDERTRKRNRYIRELYHRKKGKPLPVENEKPEEDRKKKEREAYTEWIEYLVSTYGNAKTEYIRIAKARMILRVAEMLAELGKGYDISAEIRRKAEQKVTQETRQELIKYLSEKLNRRYTPHEQMEDDDEEEKTRRPYEGSIYDLE